MSSFKTVNQDYTITCNNGAGNLYVNANFSVGNINVGNFTANNGTFSSISVSPGASNLANAVVSSLTATAANITDGTVSNLTSTTANIGLFEFNGNTMSSPGNIFIDPFNDSSPYGMVYILGNLQVTGNITAIDSNVVAIDSLLFESANSAPNPMAASGGGLAVGPYGSPYATWTFDALANSWHSNIGAEFSGNVTGQVFNGNGAGLTNVGASTAQTSGNLSGGSTNTIPFQTASGVTSFTAAPTVAGQALEWDGTTFSWVTPVNSIFGNTNQITANVSTGSVQLTLPQNIDTGANTQFNSMGLGTAATGVAGELRCTNNVTAFYASDIKFKENVKTIEDALNKAIAIGGKTFDWTDKYIEQHGGADGYFVVKQDVGVIAQDVQAVLPQAVRTRPDGSLAVDYAKLSALAFAAIAELKAEIEELKGNR